MAGFSDYSAQNFLNSVTGNRPPVFPSSGVWLALFTTAPTSDAGTGGTEVSGTAYARVQIAGEVAATATWTTGTPNLSIATGATWITPGMNVWDVTNAVANGQVGTVLTYNSTTGALVLTANAAHASTGST